MWENGEVREQLEGDEWRRRAVKSAVWNSREQRGEQPANRDQRGGSLTCSDTSSPPPCCTSGAASQGLKCPSKPNTPDHSCIHAEISKSNLSRMLCSPSESQELVILISNECTQLHFSKKPTSQQRSEPEKLCLRVVTRDWGKWWGRAGEEERGGERRRRVAHAEAGCDWWMEGVERIKGEIGSIFFILRASCSKNGEHLSRYFICLLKHDCFSSQRIEVLIWLQFHSEKAFV